MRSPRLIALIAVFALVLTACSSSGEDTVGGRYDDSSSASATASDGDQAEPADSAEGDDAEGDDASGATDDTAPETASEPTEDPEPAPTTIPAAPPVFEGERVVAIGSNVWPIVGDLLSLGVTPVAIYSQLGNQEQPDYITEAYGEVLADVPVTYLNIAEISPEEILLLQPDRVVMPDFFEALITVDPVWSEALSTDDAAIYIPVRNWQGSLGVLSEAAGTNADAAIAELQATYDARIAQIAASLDYDPAEVLFNTFQWNEDGTYLPTLRDAPIVQIADELGFQIHPSLVVENGPPLSQETVTEMDADLVFIQVRNVDFDSLATDPLWSLTEAGRTGNTFERFQFGQQAGWLETLELLDLLAAELPRYQPG
ncbi:MAG: ABC transporter substrate-binding protein [Actinomycetota bacterium]